MAAAAGGGEGLKGANKRGGTSQVVLAIANWLSPARSIEALRDKSLLRGGIRGEEKNVYLLRLKLAANGDKRDAPSFSL